MPMADLREVLRNIGLAHVHTYIQSGNVVFTSRATDKTGLEKRMETAIFEVFGFEVPVLVKLREELIAILENNPFAMEGEGARGQVYFVLLKDRPDTESRKAFDSETYDNEAFYCTPNCVYLNCGRGYGKARLNNNLVERKLKVGATTRNYKTLSRLVEMSG